MSDIIYISAATGQTLSCQLYLNGNASGSPFSATEISTTGIYTATVPGGTTYGYYLVAAFSGSTKVASGELYWDGVQEISPIMYNEIWQIGGFDINNPATNTPTERIAGTVDLDVAGYGTTTTIVTRQ